MSGIKIEDLVREGVITLEDMVTLAAEGSVDTRKSYNREELVDLVNKALSPVIEEKERDEKTSQNGSEIQLVTIKLPGTNITYATIMIDGKVMFTKNDRGQLDLSEPQEGMDQLLDVLASTSMFDPVQRKSKSTKKPGRRTFRPTKTNPGYVRDLALDAYVIDNADALAYEALISPAAFRRKQLVNRIDELEQIIDDQRLLEGVRKGGLIVELEPLTSYVARQRNVITRKVRRLVGEIVRNPEVREIAGNVFATYIDQHDEEKKRLRELCENEEKIQELYKELLRKRDERGFSEKGEQFVICLRELSIKTLQRIRARVRIPDDEYERYISTTRKWVAYAKAGDFVKTDEYIQERIISSLKQKGDDINIRDKIFNAICELGKLAIDKSHGYSALFVRFIAAGLWMEGVMEKETEGGRRQRTPGGAVNEYTDGLRNLIERYSLYGKLLRGSFEKLVEEGEFEEIEVKLDTQAGCSNLGNKLYDALTPPEQRQFARLHDEETPLVITSPYLTRLLRAYVGMNKEYFIEKLRVRKAGEKK